MPDQIPVVAAEENSTTNTNEMKFKLLLIEDDDAIVEVIKLSLAESFPLAEIDRVKNFSEAQKKLKDIRPDAIILDILEADPEVEGAPRPIGAEIWKEIWNGRLVPIVIYSAHDAELDPVVPTDHPMVKRVVKGANTLGVVIEHLKGFYPFILLIEKIDTELKLAMHTVLRDSPGSIWKAEAGSAGRVQILTRTARRRLAAMMDMTTLVDTAKLMSWEQYIVKPLDELLTGDIFRLVSGNWEDPISYRLVLTPSCDIAQGHVENVLVAKCKPMNEFFKEGCGWTVPATASTIKKSVKSKLSQAEVGGYIPLPKFPGILPSMTASLRDVELISVTELMKTDATALYKKIASVDSPFREQIAWGYVTRIGRPGMPDRDFDKWAEQLVEDHAAPPASGST
jgi:CheY-like chemotaxis protein